jgi:hypothetical protein
VDRSAITNDPGVRAKSCTAPILWHRCQWRWGGARWQSARGRLAERSAFGVAGRVRRARGWARHSGTLELTAANGRDQKRNGTNHPAGNANERCSRRAEAGRFAYADGRPCTTRCAPRYRREPGLRRPGPRDRIGTPTGARADDCLGTTTRSRSPRSAPQRRPRIVADQRERVVLPGNSRASRHPAGPWGVFNGRTAPSARYTVDWLGLASSPVEAELKVGERLRAIVAVQRFLGFRLAHENESAGAPRAPRARRRSDRDRRSDRGRGG